MKAYELKRGTFRISIILADTMLEAWELAVGKIAEQHRDDVEFDHTLHPLGDVYGS